MAKCRGNIIGNFLFFLFIGSATLTLILSCVLLIGLIGLSRGRANPDAPRIVTVYGADGKPVRQWFGKFDLSYTGNRVSFLSGDKKIVIHGAAVVDEEL